MLFRSRSRSASVLFPSAISPAWRYVPNVGYEPVSTIQKGIGVWLKFAETKVECLLGVPKSSQVVTVEPGWNMIGSISSDVNTLDVVSTPPNNVLTPYYKYDNPAGYAPTSTLEAGRGFWVKVRESGSLTLQTGNSPRTGERLETDVLSKSGSLTIKDAQGSQQTLYFARSTIEKGSTVSFDMPPLPPAGSFDARYATQRLMEFVGEGERRQIPIAISGASYPLTLKWISPDRSVDAAIVVDGKVSDASGSLTLLRPSMTLALRLVSGVASEVPERFALYQNYPNPFNPTTSIRFDLPERSNVTMKIYTMLGQEVAVLMDGQSVDAGRHSIAFDGSLFANGAYVYRVIAMPTGSDQQGTFRDEKVMMLLK